MLTLNCGLQVYMDRVRVELVSSIVGTAASDVLHLVNNEDTPFSFAFDRKMLAQAGGDPHRPVLQINPVAGTHIIYNADEMELTQVGLTELCFVMGL